MSTILKNAQIATGASSQKGALVIDGELIARVIYDSEDTVSALEAVKEYPDAETFDLEGLTLMAGGIDAHVHFREPGMEQKADMESESKAALLGGITSFIDMPNNNPPTISEDALNDKLRRANGRSWANYGFHLGATNANVATVRGLAKGDSSRNFGGIKVFMGSSTGNMLVDSKDSLQELFSITDKEVLIHSEDEKIIRDNMAAAREKYGEDIPFSEHPSIRSRLACIRSTARALEMAMKEGTRLHVLHVTTAEEVEMIRAAKTYNENITAETSANYLWFCDEDYDKMGSKVKCNPAVKSSKDREALRKALKEGFIDTIGSDHAPHLLEEKARKYPTCPSGVPSIQHSLSAVLAVAKEEDIPLQTIASVMSEKVADMFGIEGRGKIAEGNFADLVVIDTNAEQEIKPAYKCGWSPYDGIKMKSEVKMVFLNGHLAVKDGKLQDESPAGKQLRFYK